MKAAEIDTEVTTV